MASSSDRQAGSLSRTTSVFSRNRIAPFIQVSRTKTRASRSKSLALARSATRSVISPINAIQCEASLAHAGSALKIEPERSTFRAGTTE